MPKEKKMVSAAPAQFEYASDQLHDAVRQETGCDDFGQADYHTGLKVLLQSMDYDPRFHAAGRELAWRGLIDALSSRARAFAAMKANPGFADTPLKSPIVITGVPRTGTTALHRLMAVDPRLQGLQTWLLNAPMPRPPRDSWENYPAFQQTIASIEARLALAPERKAAHQSAAEGVDECCGILRQSFVSNIWNCMGWSSATYDSWWQTQGESHAYRYFRQCVQLIGMNDSDKRWLLKNPGHIEHLHEVFAIFPDAKVIQTHRDPAKAMPSMVSLLGRLHPSYEEGRYDQRLRNMMRRETEKWANAAAKTDAVKAHHPGQVLDIVHADFHADPMGVVEKVCAFVGLELADNVRPLLEQRIAEKPELAHGDHRYDIADYGMNEDEVREVFGDYVARYDLRERRK
jgi:Sulfotransferase family